MSSHPVEIDQFATLARAFLTWCDSSHEGRLRSCFTIKLSSNCPAYTLPRLPFRESTDAKLQILRG